MEIILPLDFEWDPSKEWINIAKHGVSFSEAISAFYDKNRIIADNFVPNRAEKRYYCYGVIIAMAWLAKRFLPFVLLYKMAEL